MIKTIPTRESGTILCSDRGRWTYGDLQELGEQAHSALLGGFAADVSAVFS